MKKVFCLIGLGIGTLCIILSLVVLVGSASVATGNYISHESYGGDAYTGIQNAAADTGNNVRYIGMGIEELYDKVCQIGAFILFIAGSLISLKYAKEFIGILKEEKLETGLTTRLDPAQEIEPVFVNNVVAEPLSPMPVQEAPVPQQGPRVCSNCGQTVSAEATFCANCGYKM